MRSLVVLGDADRLALTVQADGRVFGWHGFLFALGLSPCLMPSHKCSSCPASAYVAVETEYRDEEALVAALEAMGYPVERHANGASLVGYKGDERDQRAHVLVRRQHVGAMANDIGWERTASGSYRQHVSDYDKAHTFTSDRQADLKRRYAHGVVTKIAKSKGYTIASQTKAADGSVKLTLRRF